MWSFIERKNSKNKTTQFLKKYEGEEGCMKFNVEPVFLKQG